MVSSLLKYIGSVVPLTKEEEAEISKYLTIKNVSRGEHLVSENQQCEELIFITKGYFRIYISHEEEEVTIHLEGAGHFVTAFYSFISRTPSRENLQAVTESEIISIRYDDLQRLYNWNPKIERLGRLMIEKHFIEKEQRVISFIRESGEIRYQNILKKRPEFLLNIPLQYIASYLGMKPETLSRIRAKAIS